MIRQVPFRGLYLLNQEISKYLIKAAAAGIGLGTVREDLVKVVLGVDLFEFAELLVKITSDEDVLARVRLEDLVSDNHLRPFMDLLPLTGFMATIRDIEIEEVDSYMGYLYY